MKPIPVTPLKSLNKAYFKQKIYRSDIENFKVQTNALFEQINENESEEFNKNLIRDFLINTFYQTKDINTKDSTDLAIYLGKATKNNVGAIIETKKPTNKFEMVTKRDLNKKAMHEVILYYLTERIEEKNDEIKHIIITNSYEWFIFDAQLFEKIFYKNSEFIKNYKSWKANKKVSSSTEHFYSEIAKPFLDKTEKDFDFTHFILRDYIENLKSSKAEEQKKIIPLYKVFSPPHLLKEPFSNDSNQLDKQFYQELLHILGLEEVKVKSKKIIRRKKEDQRDDGSLLENTIRILETDDVLTTLPNNEKFGDNDEDKLFNIALELNITWINRILFLKLLEAQLLSYHRETREDKFLNYNIISEYDDLYELFHEVLAKRTDERSKDIINKFKSIPYLNSSLFEQSDLEKKTIKINSLKDRFDLPVFKHTVFKNNDKKIPDSYSALEYLLRFLDAFDFASDTSSDILEEKKNLINASVLGLIFEKINGYKEGSFFTPGFITMYMSRETIRRAIVQKFNEISGIGYKDFEELKKEIDRTAKGREEANEIINSLKVCDPAVGSGHFLVSVLNEILAAKFELGVLNYRDGRRIQNYKLEIENDELIVTNEEEGEIFEYYLNPSGKPITEKQQIQETLFHEKQKIIENCLFGVDINPNSVNICRLRLWIELLKNAYYTIESKYTELETLPNIDINIKQGNSLISRFDLQDDFSKLPNQTRQKIKLATAKYKEQVLIYKTTTDRTTKRNAEQKIDEIKKQFARISNPNDKDYQKYKELENQLAQEVLSFSREEKEEWEERREKLQTEYENAKAKYEDKLRTLYGNAFEWRFEFPEILDKNGNFVGFDVVIANPPYIPLENIKEVENDFYKGKYVQLRRKYDTSVMFILEGLRILKEHNQLSFIAPITWQTGENYNELREYIFSLYNIAIIINLPFNIFADAYVETAIYLINNEKKDAYSIYNFDKKIDAVDLNKIVFNKVKIKNILPPKYKIIIDETANKILKRIAEYEHVTLGEITISTQGLAGSRFPKVSKKVKKDLFPFLATGNVYSYLLKIDKRFTITLSNKKSLIKYYTAKPKILIRRIINRQDRLSVAYTNKKMVFKKDINPFIPVSKKISAKYLLGLIASKLISYLYVNTSLIATKDDFRQTTLSELREVPIIFGDAKYNKLLIKKVDKILEMKNSNPNADTSKLEYEIDKMVYKLYGLTEDERKIVEESVG